MNQCFSHRNHGSRILVRVVRWGVGYLNQILTPLPLLRMTGNGRNGWSSLTVEEEQAFLEPFVAQAEAGPLVTTHTIQRAFEERVGQSVHVSTISGLLHHHDWRKITPRPQHPQMDAEVQAH